MTPEQQAVVDWNPVAPKRYLLVQAFAGTGKTTTLSNFAKKRSDSKLLYLAFNRNAVESAKQRFPSNVDVVTFDSLCRSLYLRRNNITDFKAFNVEMNHTFVRDYLKAKEEKKDENGRKKKAKKGEGSGDYQLIAQTSDFLKYWIADAETIEWDASFAVWKLVYLKSLASKKKKQAAVEPTERVKELAKVIFTEITHHQIANRFSFGCNRKAALMDQQRTKDHIDKNYDFMLIDECQDLSPVMLAIVNLATLPTVLVGDCYQSIYGFNGLVNAFESPFMRYADRLTLSKSFRFGTDIAKMANMILSKYRFFQEMAPSILLTANDQKNTRVINQYENDMDHKWFSAKKWLILARVNRSLLEVATTLAKKKIAIHWDYFSDLKKRILELIATYKKPKDFDRQKAIAFRDKDMETIQLMLMIEKTDISELKEDLKSIEAIITGDKSAAKFVLSTVHKYKGLENDHVIVLPDVLDAVQKAISKLGEENNRSTLREEANIYYVAVTRAIVTLWNISHFGQAESLLEEPVIHNFKRKMKEGKEEVEEAPKKRPTTILGYFK